MGLSLVYLSGVRTQQLAKEDSSPLSTPLNYLSGAAKSPEQAAPILHGALTSEKHKVEIADPATDAWGAKFLSLFDNHSQRVLTMAEKYARRKRGSR